MSDVQNVSSRWRKRDVILALGCLGFVFGLVLTSPWLLLAIAGVLLIGYWWIIS